MDNELADALELFLADHERAYLLSDLKEMSRFKEYSGIRIHFALKLLVSADLVVRVVIWPPTQKRSRCCYMHAGFAYGGR